MRNRLARIIGTVSPEVRRRVIALYLFLFLANIVVWALAIWMFSGSAFLIGTAVIAYALGLRHAVDADHIAAIDNVTRKLMQDGKMPVAVGFHFSMGHSTVVVLASLLIALTATSIHNNYPELQQLGSIAGTVVSAGFLFLIALLNMVVLRDLFRTFRKVKRGGAYDKKTLDDMLGKRGLFSRLFRPLYKMINRSWHMYPLGFLFGLGFDTATEIGILGIAAVEAANGLSIWSIMIYPALFAAGMSLIDTTDGVLMLAAYGWAYVQPVRKLYYNVTITFVSVLVALLVGGIEVFAVLAGKLQLRGWFWNAIEQLSDDFEMMGYLIITIFLISWIASTLFYRISNYDEITVQSN